MRSIKLITLIFFIYLPIFSTFELNFKLKSRIPKQLSIKMAIIGPVRYSTADWFECLSTLPSSRILKRTRNSIVFFSLWTIILVALSKMGKIRIQLPTSIHTLVGSALSLLLVFRTNSSYDRFWEARKNCGSIIVACRNIAIHASIHLNKSYHDRIAKLISVFGVLFQQHLQGYRSSDELLPLFAMNTTIVNEFQSKRNRPLFALRLLEAEIHTALIEKYQSSTHTSSTPKYIEKHFIENLQSLSVQLASCERIVKQPVPVAYSRHTSRFLSLYILTLPFSLIHTIGWGTVPVIAAVYWSFVSIQEIGHFIEDPFNKKTQVIPLNQINNVIRLDVSEILDIVLEENLALLEIEGRMRRETLENSRIKDENFFAYYLPIASE